MEIKFVDIKLFTGILQKCLDNYLESNKLLSQYQSRFRTNHRTTDNIFVLKTLLSKYLHVQKQISYVCFVDFSKGFDTLWISARLHKLNGKGVGGNFLRLLRYVYYTIIVF
jgi:hypothetical protein